MLQTDKVKLTWRDRFPAYFTNLVSIVFMVSSGRLRWESSVPPTGTQCGVQLDQNPVSTWHWLSSQAPPLPLKWEGAKGSAGTPGSL